MARLFNLDELNGGKKISVLDRPSSRNSNRSKRSTGSKRSQRSKRSKSKKRILGTGFNFANQLMSETGGDASACSISAMTQKFRLKNTAPIRNAPQTAENFYPDTLSG